MTTGAAEHDVLYAIGDVHGRDDLLAEVHRIIASDREKTAPSGRARIVHLGDAIDRGPDSRGVIDRLVAGLPRFETLALMGNHEAMLLGALADAIPGAWEQWLFNGGAETIASFGLDPDEATPESLRMAMGEKRIAWLEGLPLYHREGPYLFVHAGIVPGTPLEEQKEKDLLWIRERFLTSEEDHGYTIVHGHTPSREPSLLANRIGIDTGAGWGRKLTAVKLRPGDKPEFLSAAP